MWYINQADVSDSASYPGVAKFGIALEWGSRGLEFESQHSDQNGRKLVKTQVSDRFLLQRIL
jgi:hypothetical protein